MISLAIGQFAILNLVLVGPREETHPGSPVTAALGCGGNVVTDLGGNPVADTFALEPQIASRLGLDTSSMLTASGSSTFNHRIWRRLAR
jgi:hypothetical protein